MNRIYRLVWNRSLRVMQVASELARPVRGGDATNSGESVLRRHPLVMACLTALAVTVWAPPTWAATCTICGATGGPGGTGSNTAGTGGAGGLTGANNGGSGGIYNYATQGSYNGKSGGGVGSSGGQGGTYNFGPLIATGGLPGSATRGGGMGGAGYSSRTPSAGSGTTVAGGGGGAGGGLSTHGAGGGGGGGMGSTGYVSGAGGGGGGGGGGGLGLDIAAGTSSTVNGTDTVSGGAGGNGGKAVTGTYGTGGGGGGGGGGAGAYAGTSSTLINQGAINGGQGGAGGASAAGGGGGGGGGGAGVLMNTQATLVNTGSITGGNGGAGYATAGKNGGSGLGGYGVTGSGNDSITTSGTISGGLSGSTSPQRANAVYLSGGNNTLTLQSGFSFVGNVVSSGGDTLALGGNTASTFNVSSIVATAPTSYSGTTQYGGFTYFAKTGTSTWTLTGAASTATNWNVTQGTLALQSSASLAANSAVTVTGGTLAVLNGSNLGAGSTVTLNGGTLEAVSGAYTQSQATTIGVNGGTLAVDAGANLTLSGAVLGTSGNLTAVGPGTLTLAGNVSTGSGNQTYSVNNVALGGAATLISAGTITFNTAIDSTTSGANSLALNAPTVWLSNAVGATTALGSLNVTGGQVSLGGNVTTSGTQSYDAATLSNNVTLTSTGSGAITLASTVDGAHALIVDTSGIASFNGAVGGTTALTSLVSSGFGTTKLSGSVNTTGAQTYTGEVQLTGNETLVSSGGGNITFGLGTTGNYALSVSTAGSLSFDNYVSVNGLSTNSGSFSASGAVSSLGSLAITTSNGAITQASSFSATGTSTFNAGNHAITLTNLGNALAGTVSLSNSGANNVALTNSQALLLGNVATGSGSLSLASAGSMTQSGAISQAAGAGAVSLNANSNAITLTNSGNLFTGLVSASGSSVALSNSTDLGIGNITGTSSVALSSTGALTEAGTGKISTATLTGNVSGAATLTSALNSISALGNFTAGSLSLVNSGALNVSGNVNVGTGNVGLNVGSNALTVSGSVTGGNVTLDAAGNTLLTGTLTANSTTLNTGTLQVGNGGTTGTLASNVVDNTGLSFNGSNSLSYAGIVSGTGTLAKLGSGTLTLTGSSTYVGATTISAGTLALSGTGSIANSSDVNVAIGASFDISNASTGASITSLDGVAGSSVSLGANLLTLTAAQGSFGGTIGGTGGVTVQNGSETFIGVNTYTGTTTINSGARLTLGNGSSNATISGNVVNQGTLAFNPAGSSTFGGVVSGNGALTKAGSGTLTLTGVNTYAGATSVSGGTLALSGTGNIAQSSDVNVVSGGTFDISGTAGGASIESLDGGGIINLGSKALTLSNASGNFAGVIAGTGNLILQGGTETLTGPNMYAGATIINGGTLALGVGGSIGTSSGVNVASLGTFDISGAGTGVGRSILSLAGAGQVHLGTNALVLTQAAGSFSGVIDGSAGFTVQHGSEVLTGDNTYTGATTIASGATLQIGNGGTTGAVAGDIADNGALTVNRSDAYTYAGAISGTGTLTQAGTGTLTLDGNSSGFAGSTDVASGTLVVGSVAGNGAALGGNIAVDAGATLRGHGTIGGNVDVASGAAVEPGDSIGTLTVNGNFTAARGSVLNYAFGAPGASMQTAGTGDSIVVGGNLTLNGATLNISDAGGMGAGLYNLFSYSGTLSLTGGGLAVGSTPAGQSLTLQFLTGQKQINLIDTTGFTLDFWNANGQATATQMGGGSGVWSNSSANWTDATASMPNAAMTPQPGFAIFGGTSGTVTVDSVNGGVSATGMQFAVDGYHLNGDTLTLVGSNGSPPVIRVGDGSSAGSAMTATIDNVLAGSDGLTKSDLGTLVLNGVNTYTGGTTITGGTLSVSSDANLGDASGGLSLQGGTLENTAAFTTARSIDLSGNGTLQTDADLTANGVISGNGTLSKSGTGTLLLTNTNIYTGATTIGAGTLALSGSGSIATSSDVSIAGGGSFDIAGTSSGASIVSLDGNGSVKLGQHSLTLSAANGSFGGVIGGTGGVDLAGGTETLTGTNAYTGATTISGGTLALSGSGSIASSSGVNVASGATFDISGTSSGASVASLGGNGAVNLGQQSLTLTQANGSFGGVVGGAGGLTLQGGNEIFSGTNTYAGSTAINAGTLALSGTGSIADSSGVNVAGGAFFDIAGTSSGTSVTSLTGNGNVTLGTQRLTITHASGSFDGVITGTGGLSVQDGSAVLTATNTYTGNTIVGSGATLTLGNGGATGSVAGDVTDNGALVFNRSNAASFVGVVSGAGSLTQAGSGTLTLTGINTYTGATAINAGTLALSGNGSIAGSSSVNVANGASFDISGTTQGASVASLDGNGHVALGQQSLTLTQASGSFGGVIAGAGELVLAGGTETLTGANAYTGATTINGGTLALSGSGSVAGSSGVSVASGATLDISGTSSGASITSLDGNGNVALGQQSLTLTQAGGSFNGVIAGAGGLTLQSGIEVLTGANTYAGATTIAHGAILQIGNGGTTGAIAGNVADNGTLIFARSDDTTFSAVIAGSGSLVQNGSGTLTLAGANNYSGGTLINAGMLKGDASSLQGNIVDNGNLQFDQESDGIYAGVLSGQGGFTKSGSGTLIMNGQSTFSGITHVAAGTLEIGDAATPGATLGGQVDVDSAGTLRGHGTINGNVLNDGVVRPGGSVGTLTINGNYTQGSTGQLMIDTSADGTGSRLVVNGSVALAGSALLILPSSDWKANTNYELLTSTGGISGQFASVTSNFAFVNPTLSYGSNQIGLVLARNNVAFPTVAGTGNAKAVAAAVESLGAGQPVYDGVVTLDSATAAKAFEQLQGDIHASTRTAIQENDRYVRDAIGAHLSGVASGADGHSASNEAGVSAWTSAWGHWGSHDGNDTAAQLDSNGSGLVVGADLGVAGDSRVGTLLGTGQGTARSATPYTSAHHLDTYAGLYGDTKLGAVRLQGGAVYGWQKVNASRTLDFGNLNGSADSRYNANTAQAVVDASYEFAVGRSTVAPFVNVAYDHLSTDAFHENGSAAALNVAGDDSAVTVSTLGVRGSFQLDDRGGLHANVSMGWQHASGDVTPVANERFVAGGNAFSVYGVPAAKNAAALSGGISFQVTPSVTVDATYSGQFGTGVTDQAARMSLTWMF
ncbi:autotransporter-associated beta strand repeat-containing protein [Dyella telluris]|uniref:Autotransporter-associated beta strand repeat-containing protein n=1 Tax=Dyella telluris TaxID=2763498 RepID=A0A7G8Q4Y9_9GAMM|nr:autotransporter-associated beta strand repeat-containing protein [Dyella telluris]QNK01847.1 autotransporter-associated beta strand repeat-containing protein [Dyella telluris]